MLATMSKKRKPRAGPALFVYLDAETSAALEAFIKAQEFKPSKKAIVVSALRAFLQERGYLPKSK